MYTPRFFFTLGCMMMFGATQAQTPASNAVPSPVIDPLHNDNAAKLPKPPNQVLSNQALSPANGNKSRIQSRVDKQKACSSSSLTPDVSKKNDCDPFPPDKRLVRPAIVQ